VSKGAVGLTAGYWPEDVYRYLAIPGISIDDGLVARPGKRTPDRAALIGHQGPLSYKQFLADLDQAMKTILTSLEGKGNRVAIAVADPIELMKVVFGALKARAIVFLMNPTLPPAQLTAQLQLFRPDMALVDDAARRSIEASSQGVRILSLLELRETKPATAAPRGRSTARPSSKRSVAATS